jgi:hypothetical protein
MNVDDVLPLYVVYDHPADYPDYYIVRVHYAQRDGSIRVNSKANAFKELSRARAWCAQLGLICLARHPLDDPVIVETWI